MRGEHYRWPSRVDCAMRILFLSALYWLFQATSLSLYVAGIRYDYRSTRPLTPALSPWEREPVSVDATVAARAIVDAASIPCERPGWPESTPHPSPLPVAAIFWGQFI